MADDSHIVSCQFKSDHPANGQKLITMKPKALDRCIAVACIAGILVSTYALYVEMALETQPGYKALCDISEHASCSRVLTSKFAKGFGIAAEESALKIPNCIYGITFYCLMLFLSTFDQLLVVRLQLLLATSSLVMCFYLVYLLTFVLHDFCVVCVSTYIVNGILPVFIYKKMNKLNSKRK